MAKRISVAPALLVALGALILGACSSDEAATSTVDAEAQVASDGNNELVSRSQNSDGTAVTVDEVTLDERGYVVVYEAQNGAPSTVVGASSVLDAGEHTDVQISLDNALATSTDVFVMLHSEQNGNSTFEYPGPDEPVSSDSGVLAVPIELVITGDG